MKTVKLDAATPFGTERRDVYLRCDEDVERAMFVKMPEGWYPGLMTSRPIRVVRRTLETGQVGGVTCDAAKRGAGVWVRYYGPAAVRVARKRKARE